MDNLNQHDNILVLDYNTIRFQSLGFIELIHQSSGLESIQLNTLNSFERLQYVINLTSRNISEIFEQPVTESEYFTYIKAMYDKISELSPVTKLNSIIAVTSTQRFVGKTYVATIRKYNSEIFIGNNIENVNFDIFNISLIEDFILKNNITALFLHDIRMVYDIVFNFKIALDGFTFFISKIGYNFKIENDAFVSLYPEITDIAETFNFKVAYVDVYDIPDSINDE